MNRKFMIAACAVSMLCATKVYAATHYYLATFKYPGGTFSHCFSLTRTDNYPGYAQSGTWVDTDFPNTNGTYVINGGRLHLAGPVGDPNQTDYLAVDGKLSNRALINTTYDYFSPTGIFYAAGTFTERMDSACNIPQS